MKSIAFLSPEFQKDILRQKTVYDGPCGQWTCGPFLSYIALSCYVMISLSCHHTLAPQTSASVSMEITDANGNIQLLGKASRKRLEQTPFGDWYNKNYDSYVVDSATARRLRPELADKQVMVFMGTWCGDSRREVPRFFKVLDCCGIDTSSIQLITVAASADRYKQSPGHEERGRDIFRVPDFIVLDHGRELGRVVESPVTSLEKDLLSIVSGEPYTPKYPGEALLATLFHQEKIKKIRRQLPKLTEKLRPLVSSSGELVSYAHVLDASGDREKADLVRELKTRLFPGG